MPDPSTAQRSAIIATLVAAMRRAAATGVVTSPPMPASPSPLDAALIGHCADLAANNATRVRLLDQHVRLSRVASPAAREALNVEIRRVAVEWRRLLERIGDTPATTLAGCRAKARAVRVLFDQSPEPRTARMDLAASLAADLLALDMKEHAR